LYLLLAHAKALTHAIIFLLASSPDPSAPFGVVTLASSGAEGADAAMGAMRIAQTAGYGVLPSPELPNTFLAQAYDLDDAWGPAAGPCFTTKALGGFECCDPKVQCVL
jgi:hypothetical protein